MRAKAAMITPSKRTMRILFLLACLLPAIGAGAQDLHVYFDAHRDTVYYQRQDKPVSRPEVRRGDQIYVHVVNYNNYLYELKLEVEEKKVPMAERTPGGGSAGIGSLMSMFLSPGAGAGLLGALPGLSGPGSGIKMGFAGETERPEEGRQKRALELHEQLNGNTRQFKRVSDALSGLEEEMAVNLETVKMAHFAARQLAVVRYDPSLAPEVIRKMAQEYAQLLFGETDPERITLTVLQSREKPRQQLEADLRSYRARIAELDSLHQRNTALFGELQALGPLPGTNLAEVLASASEYVRNGERRLVTLRAQEEQLRVTLAAAPALDTERLSNLRNIYTVLMANSFSKSYRYEATGEEMSIRLRLLALDTLRHTGAHDRELPPVNVRVYGGMRITTSVGLGFSQFFQRPNNFFIRDSVIQSSRKDAFIPQLSTFMHFYYPRPGKVSWGGSIGAGMPLTGGEGLQSLAFFFGPSMILGQSSRIILSTGLMGGRVSRPGQGYAAGDRFPSDPGLFTTESSYQLGYFFSVSFNLIGS